MRLDGQGHWDRPSFRLLRLDRLNLQRLGAVLAPSKDLQASGQLQGDVQISTTGDSWNCRGDVRLTRLKLASFETRRLGIGCKGDQLRLEPTTLRFGSFEALASGSIAVNKRFDLRAEVRSTDASPAIQDPLKLRITGPWQEPQWSADGQIQLPESMGLNTALRLNGQWRTPWLPSQQRAVLLIGWLSAPGLRFGLRDDSILICSTELKIDPCFWSACPRCRPDWAKPPGPGSMDVSGARRHRI